MAYLTRYGDGPPPPTDPNSPVAPSTTDVTTGTGVSPSQDLQAKAPWLLLGLFGIAFFAIGGILSSARS